MKPQIILALSFFLMACGAVNSTHTPEAVKIATATTTPCVGPTEINDLNGDPHTVSNWRIWPGDSTIETDRYVFRIFLEDSNVKLAVESKDGSSPLVNYSQYATAEQFKLTQLSFGARGAGNTFMVSGMFLLLYCDGQPLLYSDELVTHSFITVAPPETLPTQTPQFPSISGN